MLKNILNLEGVTLLNKEEQKNVNGGLSQGGCKLVTSNGNGGYTTYAGTCMTPVTWDIDANGHVFPVASGPSFCDIGNGVSYALTSNGGQSRC